MDQDVERIAAYAAYLIWLIAGWLDFRCHRRTDLPHTSGLAESSLHWVQLGLILAGGALALCFEPGRTVVCVLLVIASLHAFVGYADTRSAFGKRVTSPFEQHVHSVMDMAPWISLAWLVAATWPRAVVPGWELTVRDSVGDLRLWASIVLPGFVFCGMPAILEFRAAWRARARAA